MLDGLLNTFIGSSAEESLSLDVLCDYSPGSPMRDDEPPSDPSVEIYAVNAVIDGVNVDISKMLTKLQIAAIEEEILVSHKPEKKHPISLWSKVA
jgi:hypothetical protein